MPGPPAPPLMVHCCGTEPYWHELAGRLIAEGVEGTAVNGSHPLDLGAWVRFRQAYTEIAILGASAFVNAELEHGTPEDVEARVKQNITALAPTGRFVVMPTCCPHWRIPLRNLLAVGTAVERYGHYPIAVGLQEAPAAGRLRLRPCRPRARIRRAAPRSRGRRGRCRRRPEAPCR